MSRQRALFFSLSKAENRCAKLAPNGECERATVLVCHLAGHVRFEISDLE